MTQLLALSFDRATSPSIRLKAVERRDPSLAATYGWGLAWYPSSGQAALVIKDPTSVGKNALTHVLSDWERFSSTVFVAHLRGAAKRMTQQDTHPFQRSYGGRDWVFTHNGDLRHGFRHALPLPDDSPFTPVGRTDSEHLFCWLLTQIRDTGARRLRDVPRATLLGWLRRVNRLGTLNVVLSDGADLVAYSDAFGYKPLWWMRHTPPAPLIRVSDDEVELKLGASTDMNRTAVIVCSRVLSDTGWWRIEPGTMIVARRGGVEWRGGALPDDWFSDATVDADTRVRLAAGDPEAVRQLSRHLANAAGEDADLGTATEGEVVAPDASNTPPDHLPFPGDLPAEADDAVEVGFEGVHTAPPPPDVAETTAALGHAAEVLAAPEVLMAGIAREQGDDQRDLVEVPRILQTTHETVYVYDDAVALSSHVFRLRPVHDAEQEVLSYKLHIEPACSVRSYEDVFGNHTTETRIDKPYRRLRILATSTVRVHGRRRPKLRSGLDQRLPLVWMPWQRQMMLPYLLPPELPESELRELSDYAMSFVARQDGDLVETLKDINQTLYADYAYVPASTDLATTPYDVYAQRQGVCQDFANLFIVLARLLSIPARYRVGYIHTGTRYANARQGDASHAWVEVYLPQIGWRGFDPTNGVLVGDDHVRVACGRNYRDAAPTSGVIYEGGGRETLTVDVRVIDRTEQDAPPSSD